MRKVAIIFIIAVFLPSLVLAWLAVRSLRDQQFVLERQRLLLYQGVTDGLARAINDSLAAHQVEFSSQVETLASTNSPWLIAPKFDELLHTNWPLAEVGFSVTLAGNLLCPSPLSTPTCRDFYRDNSLFLANKESAEVYWNAAQFSLNEKFVIPKQDLVQFPASNLVATTANESNSGQADLNAGETKNFPKGKDAAGKNFVVNNLRSMNRAVNPVQQSGQAPAPNELVQAAQQAQSRLVPSDAEFAQLVGDARD